MIHRPILHVGSREGVDWRWRRVKPRRTINQSPWPLVPRLHRDNAVQPDLCEYFYIKIVKAGVERVPLSNGQEILGSGEHLMLVEGVIDPRLKCNSIDGDLAAKDKSEEHRCAPRPSCFTAGDQRR